MEEVKNAVKSALVKGGLAVLSDCETFKALALDDMDRGSRSLKALSIACDDELLAPFVEATGGKGGSTLNEACERAARHMTEDYVMDSEVASEVAQGMTEACAEFAGLEYRPPAKYRKRAKSWGQSGGKDFGPIQVVGLSAVVACTLALACFLVIAHFSPVLGCTFIPSRQSLDGVSCTVYTIRSQASGDLSRVVFMDNLNQGTVCVKPAHPSIRTVQTHSTYLEQGDKGIFFIGNGNGTYGMGVIDLSMNNLYQSNKRELSKILRWRCGENEVGEATIEIVNTSNEPVEFRKRGSLTIASHGLFASFRCGVIKETIEPGVNDYDASLLSNYLYVWKPLQLSDDVELYVNGILIPHE